LKKTAAVVGCTGDEEGSEAGCANGDRHTAIVRARTSWIYSFGRAKGFCLRTWLQPCRKGPLISGFSR
jgi:hypothetical protein